MIVDPIGRILTPRPEGLWRPREPADHFSDLRDRLERQRRVHGRARVLVDFSAMLVQPQDTVDQMRTDLAASYRSGDRVALVGARALLRMQLERVGLPAEVRMFDHMAEAEIWLTKV